MHVKLDSVGVFGGVRDGMSLKGIQALTALPYFQ
jgi:hypothetical protein